MASQREPVIGVPRPGEGIVERQRLAGFLDRIEDRRLILIRAPAGYGKTTLIAEWWQRLNAAGWATPWLTLNKSLDDPTVLTRVLARSLAGKGLAADEIPATADADIRAAHVVAQLNHPETRTVVFLDDLHAIQSSESLDLVRRFVELMPGAYTVVAATRCTPHSAFSRLRVTGELLELGSDHLALCEAEVHELLQKHGLRPDRQVAARLRRRTEGWAAAVRLSALAVGEHGNLEAFVDRLSGTTKQIVDYFVDEVFSEQPEDVRRFLLETSILGRLSPESCEVIAGRIGAAAMLEFAERAGLFVFPIDSEGRLYRFHSLFAEFLRDRLLREYPSRILELHRAASGWLRERGDLAGAIDHALQAGEGQTAVELMDVGAWRAISEGHFSSVASWSRELHELGLSERPLILVAAAWAHALQQNTVEAERLLDRVVIPTGDPALASKIRDAVLTLRPLIDASSGRIDEALREAIESRPALSEGAHFERGALANVSAYCLTAKSRFEEARRYVVESKSFNTLAGSDLGTSYASVLGGVIEAAQGKLGRALERYGELNRGGVEQGGIAGLAAGLVAEVLYERNQLDLAESRIEAEDDLVEVLMAGDVTVPGQLTRSRIHAARGHFDLAERVLEVAEIQALERNLPRVVSVYRWERVRLALATGRVREAQALTEQTRALLPPQPDDVFFHVDESEARDIGDLRLRIRCGEAKAALPRLRTLVRSAERHRRGWRALRLRILLAEALDVVGEHRLALREIRESLSQGCRECFVRSFVDAGPRVLELVSEIREGLVTEGVFEESIEPAYHDLILYSVSPGSPAPAFEGEAPHLSAREAEILGLVERGLSNRAIASQLFVSVNTVKWHLRRIYERFRVRSRTQALAVARQHQLLA